MTKTELWLIERGFNTDYFNTISMDLIDSLLKENENVKKVSNMLVEEIERVQDKMTDTMTELAEIETKDSKNFDKLSYRIQDLKELSFSIDDFLEGIKSYENP